ncbi:unnamed protein product [Bursaphelenchus xylophilus]|uniref:Pre-rRNA-processing protein TSR1 homolog n=1 Tax=Bursaphelenchus xylophilus TaxID=6326 RepID=A0A811KAS7_BURXY|nr:unnamed protein product [Bursaphelenchus xylophilus]CAG9092006.1 unnamed protein product [Bursaphelenchus xylophilus]
MFFNKEDIDWFKPVELYADNGHRGHIKDSIGTHGLMKCVFNLPLGKQDAVKMNLFKRVFLDGHSPLILFRRSQYHQL